MMTLSVIWLLFKNSLSQEMPLKRWTSDLEVCLIGKAQQACSLLPAEEKENLTLFGMLS